MAFGTRSDEQGQQDEVLSKVDALLRRHRGGGLDAVLEVSDDADIPTLTEVLEEPKSPANLPAEPAPAMIDRVEAEPSDAEREPGAADTREPLSIAAAEALPDTAVEGASATDAELHSRPAAASWDQEWLALLRPDIERAVAEAIAAQMPRAIQEQVVPEVMLQLGDGLNRLRDAMRSTIRGVVQETIEQEVKRALKALLKERMKR